jgi:hypothetical protein
MSEVCQSLINDYLSGSLNIGDLEQGLASIFDAMPGGHVDAQNYLQSLYTEEKIDSDGFTQISQVISRVNIQSTLKNSQETDISYFGEDRTMHLTDLSDLEPDDGDDANDKTVIVSVNQGSGEIEISEPSLDAAEDMSPISPKIIEKPHKSARYENLGPGVTLKDRFVLLEKLGQGGMGVVFKAKDLLKVEAQDNQGIDRRFQEVLGIVHRPATRSQQGAAPGASEYRHGLRFRSRRQHRLHDDGVPAGQTAESIDQGNCQKTAQTRSRAAYHR